MSSVLMPNQLDLIVIDKWFCFSFWSSLIGGSLGSTNDSWEELKRAGSVHSLSTCNKKSVFHCKKWVLNTHLLTITSKRHKVTKDYELKPLGVASCERCCFILPIQYPVFNNLPARQYLRKTLYPLVLTSLLIHQLV